MIEKNNLSNGMRIVTEEMPHVRSISFGVWVKTGSRNEENKLNGISHFIEHMIFKGSENRTAKQVADEMDAIGGQINAYTTKEYTCYYIRVLDNHLETGLDILSDILINPKFEEDEIQKECNVITEEILMYEDSPEDFVYENLEKGIFTNNPLGNPISGDAATIKTFTRKTFMDYYKHYYHPQNIVISAAGGFKTKELLETVDKYFGQLMRNFDYPVPSLTCSYSKTVVKKEKDIEQVHLCLGFPGIPLGDDDAHVMAVFNTIFGGGMSSRLFQNIREQHGLTYSIYSHNISYLGCGVYAIYAALNPGLVPSAMDMIEAEIKRLNTEPIENEQVAKTKEQLKSNYIMGLESTISRMSALGRSSLMLERILTPEEVFEKVDRVTTKDIHRITADIFAPDKMSIAMVGNGVE